MPNVAYQEYELKKAKSGANNIRLSNVGPKAFETELGKMDAEQLGKWREGAMTAQNTLSTVKKLQEADANGAYSGGAANLKMTVGSYINGITGSTPKGQIGSELYNAEASKLVLDQIKTLGANPSKCRPRVYPKDRSSTVNKCRGSKGNDAVHDGKGAIVNQALRTRKRTRTKKQWARRVPDR